MRGTANQSYSQCVLTKYHQQEIFFSSTKTLIKYKETDEELDRKKTTCTYLIVGDRIQCFEGNNKFRN